MTSDTEVLTYLKPFLDNESLSYFSFEFSPPIDSSLSYKEQAERALKNSRLVMCNENFARAYNSKKDQILNKSYYEIIPEHDEALIFLEEFARKEFSFENEIVTEVESDGTTLHTLNNIWCTIKEKHIHSIFGIDINITEQVERERAVEKHEKMLSKILSVIPVGIYQHNEHGNLTFGNAMAEKILGQSVDGAALDEWLEKIHTDDKARILEAFNQSIESRNRFSEEYRITRNNGDMVHVLTESEPIYDENDRFQGMIGFLSDISQRIEFERKLQQSIIERELLLAEIHHRVKNNLAIVSGLIDLQRYSNNDEVLDSELLNTRTRIMSIASVHKLLYESENFSDISIKKLIKKLCREIKKSYESDQLKVKFRITADPVFLNANRAVPFGLIVNELVTNSYKHGFKNKESGTITIHVESVEDQVRFSYSDDGDTFSGNYTQSSIPKDSLGFQLIYNLSVQLSSSHLEISDAGGFNFTMDFERENKLAKGSTINKAFGNELKQLFG